MNDEHTIAKSERHRKLSRRGQGQVIHIAPLLLGHRAPRKHEEKRLHLLERQARKKASHVYRLGT